MALRHVQKIDPKAFPMLGIADVLEKESRLADAKHTLESVDKSPMATKEHKKEAKEKILKVNKKLRAEAKRILIPTIIEKKVSELIPAPEVNTKMFMTADDYKRLKDDIEERGVQVPLIVKHGTSQVICGIHRLRAAVELNLEVVPIIYGTFGNEKDILFYATSDNLNRRQLTMDEKKSLARELLLIRGIIPAGRPKDGEIRPLTLKDIRDKTGVSERTLRTMERETEKEELPKNVRVKEKKDKLIEERIEKYGLSWGKRAEVDKTFAKTTAESIEEKIRWILEDLSKGDRLDLIVRFLIVRQEE